MPVALPAALLAALLASDATPAAGRAGDAAPGAAAPADEAVARLRFAWRAPLRARVSYRRTRLRPGAPPSAFTARYETRVEGGDGGLRILTRGTSWRGDLPFPRALAKDAIRASEQVVQRVGADGKFAALEGVEAMRPVLARVFEEAKVPPAAAERALPHAEAALRVEAEELWNLAVGFWTGADLRIGETYALESEAELPLLAGTRARQAVEFAVRGRVPCAAGERVPRCVEATLRATPEAAALARAAAALLGRLFPAGLEDPEGARRALSAGSELLLVTDPETLLPRRVVWTKAVRVEGDGPGPARAELVDRSEWDYRYLPPEPPPRRPRERRAPRPAAAPEPRALPSAPGAAAPAVPAAVAAPGERRPAVRRSRLSSGPAMSDLLEGLNDAQREAVLHGAGPLLVLAGAGSGKTRVIVHRIARLVRDEGVVPWRILAVTFTNKAAGEMRERLGALLGLEASELWVQTFHAFGARFLRREAARARLSPSFPIYDDDDQLRLVKGILAELGADDGEVLTAREALSRIDGWKGLALAASEVAPGDYDVEGRLAREVYARYETALARAGAVDFGDLLMRPVRLLQEDDGLRRRWSERFEHVLVDEFQDTNPAQYRLLRLLTGARANVCVVGDDDQAIYRWRGADVENILGFDKDFPGTRVVKLEQNYRSTRNVLDAAHAVISRAARRREKRLWTEAAPGAPLALLVGQDEHDEAERIARAVAQERARGTAGDEIAVLYRTNAQSRPLEAALRAARVPYVIVRGTSFYERAEVKDAAAYLRLALEPRSDLDLERVVNRPPRGIGEKTVERLRAHARAAGTSLYDALGEVEAIEGLKPAARRALSALRETLAGLARDAPALDAGIAVQEVLSRTGLLARLEAERTEEAAEKAENLVELVAAAREFDEALLGEPPPRDPEEPRTAPLARFLEQIALLGEADQETPEGRVSLMTLHAAKGLEFTAVFLSGLEEGTFPREPWGDPSAAERAAAHDEERRLCYVGMTRAKERLTLSLARRRMGFGEGGPSFRQMEPSRFLTALPPELFGEAVAREVRAREGRAAAPPAARPPVVRRHPGALPGEPHIELDEASAGAASGPDRRARGAAPAEAYVDYEFDQRPEAGRSPFARGERVLHPSLGEGRVVGCDGAGGEAKVTVRFDVGEKRVLARFLRRSG